MTQLEYFVKITTGQRALPVLIWEYKLRKQQEEQRLAVIKAGAQHKAYG